MTAPVVCNTALNRGAQVDHLVLPYVGVEYPSDVDFEDARGLFKCRDRLDTQLDIWQYQMIDLAGRVFRCIAYDRPVMSLRRSGRDMNSIPWPTIWRR